MKITKIEKIEDTYFVTKSPNLLERILGNKNIIEKYKYSGRLFKSRRKTKIFIKSTGEVIGYKNKMCKILNNYVNSF